MTYTLQTDVPPLSSQQEALLAAFAANGFDPQELLKNPAFTTSEVLAFLVSPAVRAHLTALNETSQIALNLRAARARRIAMDGLERVVENTAADIPLHHRASAALLRASAARLIPTTTATPTSRPSRPKPQTRPSTPPNPSQTPAPEPAPDAALEPRSGLHRILPYDLDDPRLIAMLTPKPGDTPETLDLIAQTRAGIPTFCEILRRPIPSWFTDPAPTHTTPEPALANA